MAGDELTVKEKRFVDAYLTDAKGNATEAARMAGYKDERHAGYELRQKPHIRARIDEILLAESLSAAEVIHELTAVAKAPTTHFMQVTGVDKETGEMQVRQDYSSKIKSLELLGKHHGLFTDKVEHSGGVLIRGYPGVDLDAV